MALAAVGAESRRTVIGGLRRLVCCSMTAVAIRPNPDILMLLLVRVTGLTVGRQMFADQGEGCPRVALGHIRNQPRLWSVASIASCTQLPPVQIVVASNALVVRPFEVERRMA
jgi:hypothetical protein